ncbi:MAG: Bifunctional transcriptional activator/DNA repair enzyme Ada [Chlamydiae bacterium]|nr:Bifunctional transcriptional activator/DNA repair enzyme Ada [Chlamydiota bacterium]
MTAHSEEGKGPLISVRFEINSGQITRITLSQANAFCISIEGCEKGALQEEIFASIKGYLQGREFEKLPFDFSSFTPFMRAGIEAIRTIPFGQTATYGEIAKIAGNPKAARALGNVCNRNPFPLVIPCHRVVAGGGSLGGYAYGALMKRELLQFERSSAL